MEPSDPELYKKVKSRVRKKMPKHSAYRSGHETKQYIKEFQEKYGNRKKPYKGKKRPNTGLSRWFKEKWRNQRGEVGYKKKSDVYRPTKRITRKTPKTFSELPKHKVDKARREKAKKGKVKKF